MAIQNTFGERTINELLLMYKSKQINLKPGFQRNSVWGLTDRRRLIQSILAQYPLPSIFLYQRRQKDGVVYDVIDGKQRLETILMFARCGPFGRESFGANFRLGSESAYLDWAILKKKYPEEHHLFLTYKVQTAEVTGDLSEIIDLFVRINSTGKPLTSGEKRNARYFQSPFLKAASQLVSKFHLFFQNNKILSASEIERMKGTELMSELLMSIHKRGIINKKTSLDKAIGNETLNLNTLGRLQRECTATINLVRRMFPDLKSTRFRNSADFYSLCLIVWEMQQNRFILNDRKRNEAAALLLRNLSDGVDRLREQLRQAKPAKAGQRLYSDYLLTVQGDTDSAANRERRAELLRGLLFSIFEKKDGKRTFSPEQRRILWNGDDKKACSSCRQTLTWENFTVDHVLAFSKGGATALHNAQLMCRSCNSRKGAR